MIIPNRLNKGDVIGVVAPSNPIIGDNIEEIKRAKEIVEQDGFKVKFSKNLFSNTTGYSATAKEKAEDLNNMFADKEVKMIWCAKGGQNSNSTFEYLDYELIKNNPKIICGYSDITSLTNMITAKTGLVTFSATNFKTIATDETDYSYKEALKRFVEGSLELGKEESGYVTIKEGVAEGELIGGNLFLTRGMVAGKYSIDFTDKILFLEDKEDADLSFLENSLVTFPISEAKTFKSEFICDIVFLYSFSPSNFMVPPNVLLPDIFSPSFFENSFYVFTT